MPKSDDGRWDTKLGLFVSDYGAEKLASELRVTPFAPYHWVAHRAYPRTETAREMVRIAAVNGTPISLEDIYSPGTEPMLLDRLESAGFFKTPKGNQDAN